jgi:negative regulator of flagellin synthesis FlgM
MKIQDQTTRPAAELGVTGPRTGRTEAQGAATPADTATQAAGGSAGPAATVSLSSRSRELHGALEAAKAAPDVRDEKVAEVRRRLESGTYVIDPTRIARGILDSQG